MNRYIGSVAVAMAMVALAGCGNGKEGEGPWASGPAQAVPLSGPYRLKMPKVVLEGTFEESDHALPDRNIPLILSGQIENGVPAFATYRPADRKPETSGPVLAVTGVYGTVLSPVTARDELLKYLDGRNSVPTQSTVIIGPRTITPKGFSEPVSCRIVQETDQFGTT
ncbi:hypothetical protein [Streptomyces sp. NPDC089799]|uniref:hypothetical protein n=1 Tax=Streptomyces sp. NPDC089799 TaxID=3155066 RepID=UPI0034371B6D